MMFAKVNEHGCVEYLFYSTDASEKPERYSPENPSLIVLAPENVDNGAILTRYVWKNAWIDRGIAPTKFHEWKNEGWMFNFERARKELSVRLEQERSRRNFLPIVVNGTMLDVDAVAQKNFSDKIHEVRERIRLGVQIPPELLIWKTADNQVLSWTGIQEYHDWLSTVAITLSERGTRLYAAMWQHKTIVEGLTNADTILTYDITKGWPA